MENVLEIPTHKWESQRKFPLPKGLRDAAADYLRRRWPSGTAKHAAREFNLTLDRAREVASGRGSLTSIEAMFQRGGPAVFLPILEEATGASIAHHFRELREHHEENGRRLASLFGPGGAGDAVRPGGHSGGAWARDDEREPASRRVGKG